MLLMFISISSWLPLVVLLVESPLKVLTPRTFSLSVISVILKVSRLISRTLRRLLLLVLPSLVWKLLPALRISSRIRLISQLLMLLRFPTNVFWVLKLVLLSRNSTLTMVLSSTLVLVLNLLNHKMVLLRESFLLMVLLWMLIWFWLVLVLSPTLNSLVKN